MATAALVSSSHPGIIIAEAGTEKSNYLVPELYKKVVQDLECSKISSRLMSNTTNVQPMKMLDFSILGN